MAITHVLGPNPKWYFVNNNGKPLAGGKFNTYSSLNNSMRKNVFSTPSDDFPLPNPATIDANGTLGPFWFRFDSLAPTDGYLIIVTDANGQVIWTADDYFASGGGGGGSTTVLDINNLINNNVMWRHAGSISPVPTFSIIAPSNHANLVSNENLVGKSIVDRACPDIVFIKNNQSGTDIITFPRFTLGDEPIVNDTAPVDYFNYTCSVAGTETSKFLQFPVSAKVQNLQNQDVIGSFWARFNGGSGNALTLQWFQFYGDGAGATPALIQQINVPFVLNADGLWHKYNYQDTVPDVSAANLGAPNSQGPNDALFLRITFPVSVTTNIDFTKPTMYLGTALPDMDFVNYDNIESVAALPRTGDVRISMNSFVPFGWVPCNDGVLSNGDGAIVRPTLIPVSRNNIDTYPLYYLIWNLTSGYSSFAPIYDSAGALSTRGADAIADFAAGKQLQLTRMLGRVLAGGNANLTASQTFSADAGTDLLTVTDATQFPTGTPVLVTNTGGALPTPLATLNVPNVYYSIYVSTTTIRLAASLDNAQSGAFTDISSAGSGTQTIQTAVGTYFGQGYHVLTIPELPAHNHPGSIAQFASGQNYSAPRQPFVLHNDINSGISVNHNLTIASQGSNSGHNTMQPTAFMNVMLKL